MNDLNTIVNLIETLAKNKYGSINALVAQTGINRSIVDNMKRDKPSIPNVLAFCELANSLDVTVDFLLTSKESNKVNKFDVHQEKLAADERSLINTYREMNDDGKTKMLDESRRIWADYPLPIEDNQSKSKSPYYPMNEKNVGNAG